MRLGRELSRMTSAELKRVKDELNLTDTELEVFEELSRGRSKVTISCKLNISVSTVSNRIKDIKLKLMRIGGDAVD